MLGTRLPRTDHGRTLPQAHQGGGATARDDHSQGLRGQVGAHPWCVLCSKTVTVADHFPESRRGLVARGVSDPDAWSRLRPLCTSCHNRETAKHQPGGWAAERVKPRRS
jgi:5-methylcytosine-specific restriction protein A